jgi:hypothetical protein
MDFFLTSELSEGGCASTYGIVCLHPSMHRDPRALCEGQVSCEVDSLSAINRVRDEDQCGSCTERFTHKVLAHKVLARSLRQQECVFRRHLRRHQPVNIITGCRIKDASSALSSVLLGRFHWGLTASGSLLSSSSQPRPASIVQIYQKCSFEDQN